MIRFTIAVSDELNAWLEEQARLHKRSKSSEVFTLLEKAKADLDTAAVGGWFRRVNGSDDMCIKLFHYFSANSPEPGTRCNCGATEW